MWSRRDGFRGDGFQAWCRACRKSYDREYCQRNGVAVRQGIHAWTAVEVSMMVGHSRKLIPFEHALGLLGSLASIGV